MYGASCMVAIFFIGGTLCCEWRYRTNLENCATYYECVYGKPLLRHCPVGTLWNEDLMICDWPWSSSCPSQVDVAIDNEISPATGEACSGGNLERHPSDCSKFLICNHGAWVEMQCNGPLYFNPDTAACDWPENVECNNPPGEGTQPVEPVVPPESEKPPTSPPTKPPTSPPSTTEIPTETPITDSPEETTYVNFTWPTPYPTPTDSTALPSPGEEKFKVICYYTNWAWYRQGIGKYVPEDIDPHLCTHVIYSFALLNTNTWGIKPADSWADIDNKFFQRVVALRSNGGYPKVMIGIGGWNDSGGTKYSQMLADPKKIKAFIDSVVNFIKKYNMDGVDLDYEYPTCPQTNCNSHQSKTDRQGFVNLVRDLRKALPAPYIISAAVTPHKNIIEAGYDVPALVPHLDWIGAMEYDIHGSWDKETGHIAPLYYDPRDKHNYLNANTSLHIWMNEGCPAEKLIMGIPLYGRSWTLASKSNNGFMAPAYGGGESGKYTRSRGFLSYYEICSKSWDKIVQHKEGLMGPYAYKGSLWVSYDDVPFMEVKANYVKNHNLGGVMVWALDLDDFNNVCGSGKYPLLKTLNNVLKSST